MISCGNDIIFIRKLNYSIFILSYFSIRLGSLSLEQRINKPHVPPSDQGINVSGSRNQFYAFISPFSSSFYIATFTQSTLKFSLSNHLYQDQDSTSAELLQMHSPQECCQRSEAPAKIQVPVALVT